MSDITAMGDAGKAMPVPRGRYSDTETYDYLDFVYCGDASYIAKKLTTGNPPAEDNEYWQLFARGGTLTENSDVSDTTVTFEMAENRANIFSKESLRTIAGKISKMYSDLKAVAFSGRYVELEGRVTVTNNDLATIPGTAWDAVRGAQIRKDLDKLNSDLLDASVGIEIADPTSVHEIWAKISEPQWWRRTSIRKIAMTDANHIILSRNGYWLGTIAVNSGNVTGVLINHWTGEAFTLRASTYNTDSISFTFLSS